MEDFMYLVVEIDQDEDGAVTSNWFFHSLEEARHVADAIYGYTIIYKLEEV